MKHEFELRRAHEAVVLERMRMTRERFRAADKVLRTAGIDRSTTHDTRNSLALSLMSITRALYDAPRVTLLGSIALAALILGPKRIVPLVVRTHLASWVTRNVRAAVSRH